MELKNKKVLVIGLAVTGVPLVRVLKQQGAQIIVNDMKSEVDLAETIDAIGHEQIEYILGRHPEELTTLGELDLVVLSPGVPLDIPFIQQIKAQGIEIIGEVELAFRLSRGKIVAITGTNGKTTTTALTGEIFKGAGKNTYVVGNIGVPFIEKALDTTEEDVIVIEVSSFQLESIKEFHPKVGTLLNLTPDHLNRHKTIENYREAKLNLFMNQSLQDYAVLNYDDITSREAGKTLAAQKIYFSRKQILEEGVFVDNQLITIQTKEKRYDVIHIDEIKILGQHNLENALAATAMTFILGVSAEDIAKGLRNFPGVAHRLEFVEEIEGVKYINDSKGTNTDASIKAIEAAQAPIILLAGGQDKGGDFTDFVKAFDGKVKHLLVYGETSDNIYETALHNNFKVVSQVRDLEEAVIRAKGIAQAGDTILLSPACASWDMYPNFEARGQHFKKLVSSLRRS
ncbi:UDP-N-acetylmuramoylalanine--D-glutamate ligase [Alkaliphilus metalliredigens QYMF]|uniref:UDP-N-acetylmuramoylalanine--D-glutamate ligase n=1 Tax=Alkaliphilus metalliredigens (strain QYMF) TaxID=293826 RepID=MURD_ALKMQ|nr:UDP-N-acetylmuramoyl-L-alanine--D-glutamate ligase [Alkaliphilus metalliredigens]A6TS63.1 RecName: Full=UDP-N-acetylmuramoylalanine--D-glutamate ligase; AltName: Full=D-glutamic acid-adding enzyme; AltName: Full=UDP-N-acetylmuramoyl-L-alanyl-D-glutamate synthetase [Alkaliphilus metalliredigens QYMF]ABR49031.1 UDP-N-acetylmuramoylalanine--D-glutamate ligase [Alkaliphilus metalliredigens QYMF]